MLVLHLLLLSAQAGNHANSQNKNRTKSFEGCLLNHEKNLIIDLLRCYDKRVRPVTVYQDTLTIGFDVQLQQIIDLDEKNKIMTTSMYMDWQWYDSFLHWDPSKYGGIDTVILPSTDVWTPDVLVYNSRIL